MTDTLVSRLAILVVAAGGLVAGRGHSLHPAKCQEGAAACHSREPTSAAVRTCGEGPAPSGRTATRCRAQSAACLASCAALTQTLFVAHEGTLVSYDIASAQARHGVVPNVSGPTDAQALEDGTIMTNLTGSNEILAVDGATMVEVARIPSSGAQAVRPVHSYISPSRNGKQYWMALNDGLPGVQNTTSAAFIDITAGSATRFHRVGEVALGIGHHKAAFSNTTERVTISNIADCTNVLSVYDYSNIGTVQTLATLTSAAAGWTAPDPGEGHFNPRFCDPTYRRGAPPAPHGCATSRLSGRVYCNLTSSGEMVVVNIDATPPTFRVLATNGKGDGFTLYHPAGRYMYTMQEQPREGHGGAPCQIGQIAVTDAMTDSVVSQTPVLYKGPRCAEPLTGTAAATANLGHSHFTHDGSKLYVPTSGGFNVPAARVDQLVAFNTADPTHPVQLPSVRVGVHTSHSASALSGDGLSVFVVNTVDGTVSQIDAATGSVTHTFTVQANPKTVATFGAAEGPSEQTGPIRR
jgi:YVTN family beta-propeller protein